MRLPWQHTGATTSTDALACKRLIAANGMTIVLTPTAWLPGPSVAPYTILINARTTKFSCSMGTSSRNECHETRDHHVCFLVSNVEITNVAVRMTQGQQLNSAIEEILKTKVSTPAPFPCATGPAGGEPDRSLDQLLVLHECPLLLLLQVPPAYHACRYSDALREVLQNDNKNVQLGCAELQRVD